MRTLVTYLVAAALTLHMLLGCCWHHAHESSVIASEPKQAQKIEAPVPVSPKRCCCHRHQPKVLVQESEPSKDKQDAPRDRPESCGQKCSFVTTNRVQVDQVLDIAPLSFLSVVVSVESANGLTYIRLESRGVPAAPPPVRIHLLHQLLLI